MTIINGQVRCSGCGDMLPTDRHPGEMAWVTCRACGRTAAGRTAPLIRVTHAADAHLLGEVA